MVEEEEEVVMVPVWIDTDRRPTTVMEVGEVVPTTTVMKVEVEVEVGELASTFAINQVGK